MASTPMTVMIPLGGIGSRFQKEGYLAPKPFVSVLGKPMIMWVLDSLKLGPNDSLVIVYNPSWMSPKYWGAVRDSYPNLILVELPGPTRGAAETVVIGLHGLPKNLRSQPIMLVDGDCFYDEDIVAQYRSISKRSNGVFFFVDTQPKPIYSYIVFDPAAKRITQVKEKVKISDHANTGCYCFSNGSELMAQCQALLDAGTTQTGNLATHTVGEYYTSGVIAAMIDEGATFTALQVDPTRMHVLGTPTQLLEWSVKQTTAPACRVCFDLDHTLLTAPTVKGELSTCVPMAENVACCRALYEQGHTIIIQTERGMAASGGNPSAATASAAGGVLALLTKHRIPYHELCFGKPAADFYVDDKAVVSTCDLHKAVGHYPGSAYVAQPAAPTPPAQSYPAPQPASGGAPWVLVVLAAIAGAGVGAAAAMRAK